MVEISVRYLRERESQILRKRIRETYMLTDIERHLVSERLSEWGR